MWVDLSNLTISDIVSANEWSSHLSAMVVTLVSKLGLTSLSSFESFSGERSVEAEFHACWMRFGLSVSARNTLRVILLTSNGIVHNQAIAKSWDARLDEKPLTLGVLLVLLGLIVPSLVAALLGLFLGFVLVQSPGSQNVNPFRYMWSLFLTIYPGTSWFSTR